MKLREKMSKRRVSVVKAVGCAACLMLLTSLAPSLKAEDLASGNDMVDSPLSYSIADMAAARGTGSMSRLVITQYGIFNKASVIQSGAGNQIRLNQTGAYNQSAVAQYGANNNVDLIQMGSNNMVNINQLGVDNQIDIAQDGMQNTINITQNGSQSFSLQQIGDGAVVNITQYGH